MTEKENEKNREEIEKIIKLVTLKYLSKEARSRLNTIKIAHPDLYSKFVNWLITAVQSGLDRELSEKEMIRVLDRLREKKEFKIRW